VDETTLKKRSDLVLKLIFVFVGVLICGMIYMGVSDNGKNKDDHSTMASIQCRDFVRDRLKSPSTADFPMSIGRDVGNNTYVLYSYVDAENSFGAKIRNDFYCKIKYTGGDDGYQSNWDLVELTIDE
jgi:hypothetical protein